MSKFLKSFTPLSDFCCTVWSVDPDQPAEPGIASAASIVQGGGVVIYPTETFYGLGGDPASEAAIKRIFRIKGRDFLKPLPLIASDMDAVRRAAGAWPSAARQMAEAFWPGPLTLLLPVASGLPPLLHAGTGKIAVRISSHPVARALAAAVGGLLISTSANASGQPACRHPEEIPAPLLGRVDGLLHAGSLPGGAPSTIVDVTMDPPRLMREGILPWDAIQESRN